MNRFKYALSAVVVLLTCVFCLAIPALAANWQQHLLMQKPTIRQGEQDSLSEEARKIPIAYALHKRKLADGYYTGNEREFTPQIKQEMLTALQGVFKAELMPQSVYDDICSAIESPDVTIYCRQDEVGFKEISLNLVEKKDDVAIGNSQKLVVQWHTDTSLVTQLSYNVTQIDSKAVIEKYKKYLGLDVLTDWHSINESDAIYSDIGQLYLLCRQNEDMIYLTIAPVGHDEAVK